MWRGHNREPVLAEPEDKASYLGHLLRHEGLIQDRPEEVPEPPPAGVVDREVKFSVDSGGDDAQRARGDPTR